jgi:hypothetical protein
MSNPTSSDLIRMATLLPELLRKFILCCHRLLRSLELIADSYGNRVPLLLFLCTGLGSLTFGRMPYRVQNPSFRTRVSTITASQSAIVFDITTDDNLPRWVHTLLDLTDMRFRHGLTKRSWLTNLRRNSLSRRYQ